MNIIKRAVSLVVLLALLNVFYQVAFNFFKKSHVVSYAIPNGDVVFQVKETFQNKKYYFEIKYNQYQFLFESKNKFNKTKEVIEQIEYQEGNGFLCIYPDLKKNASSYIACSDGNQMYAYNTIHNEVVAQQLEQRITEKKLPLLPERDDYKEEFQEVGLVEFNQQALEENLLIWNYRGYYVLENNHILTQDITAFDRYENTLSTIVGKYYVTPVYNDNQFFSFSRVYIFNMDTHIEELLDLPTEISNNSYVNGVVGDTIYIFDSGNMQQVAIDIKKRTSEVIARETGDGQYYNGKYWEDKNVYDFAATPLIFPTFDEEPLKALYSYRFAYQYSDSYYFYDGTAVYQVYKDFPNVKIQLFTGNDIREIQIQDGVVYYLLGSGLYRYKFNQEVRMIAKSNEFSYNSKNAYAIYRK